jgi:UDP-N-acetylglucosamine--N-acetylmuramyl-(pentapeptide) pyrophosphoryl-undecaprenol N-acetylglucosamine transferase
MAVAAELRKRQPEAKLIYVGQTGDPLGDIPANDPNINEVYTVRAGKLRRFHGEGWKQLLDLPTVFRNVRDMLYVVIGIFQSYKLAGRIKPDVVFSRGGYVSVPVSLGAHLRGVPYMTHDSDPVPSLANRLIARWAAVHAVALPKNIYPYPQDKTVTTGIPLNREFVPVDDKLKAKYRQEIDVPRDCQLLFVIGGGLGSQRVNTAVAEAVPHLLKEFSDLYVIQAAGRANEADLKTRYATDLTEAEQGRVKVFGYINDVYRYSGAADLVITRAGATNLAEFAVQGKACIIVPSAFLVGGHQLKNAEYLGDKEAAMVLAEGELAADPNRLAKQVSGLLKDGGQRRKMEKNLAGFAKPNAARELADLILEQV